MIIHYLSVCYPLPILLRSHHLFNYPFSVFGLGFCFLALSTLFSRKRSDISTLFAQGPGHGVCGAGAEPCLPLHHPPRPPHPRRLPLWPPRPAQLGQPDNWRCSAGLCPCVSINAKHLSSLPNVIHSLYSHAEKRRLSDESSW